MLTYQHAQDYCLHRLVRYQQDLMLKSSMLPRVVVTATDTAQKEGDYLP
jgi:hypothetical protein